MRLVGIDPGVKTGIAVWDDKKQIFETIRTVTIIEAMRVVRSIKSMQSLRLYVEDARMRKWFGNKSREALQGAGSIKRDCSIWQEFCEYYEVPFTLVPPRSNSTKLSAAQFKEITGWEKRTSEHARDAAMLVYGR